VIRIKSGIDKRIFSNSLVRVDIRGGWLFLLLCAGLLSGNALAGLSKAVVNVDPGNTKLAGQTFTYILSYSCSNTSGDCPDARIVDSLPPEVVYVSHAVTSDVASVNAPAVDSTGTVEFIMNSPLTAGNSGDVTINVRFPVGTTPDGTVASNTADGVNLETTQGTYPSNPVTVTAVAGVDVSLSKTLRTSPSYLDMETRYRLRVSNTGELSVSNLDVVDTLPLGDVLANPPIFLDATPDADCEPGCLGTKTPTLQWSGLSVNAGQNRDITVRVQYDSADFSNGVNVTNEFTAEGDPLGETPNQNFGTDQTSHNVETLTPNPRMSFSKTRGGPIPPAFNQEFYYQLRPRNTGNVALENMILEDKSALPIQFSLTSVRTGRYNSDLSDYASGVGVQVEYEASDNPGVWVLLGSSPDVSTNTTLAAPGLGVGVYVTGIRWLYGTAGPGMRATSWGNRPRIYGQIIDPDNSGSPVNVGDTIQNCANLDSEYPSGTSLSTVQNCTTFNVSGDFVQFNPDKDDMTQTGPYVGGDTINWRLRARSHSYSSTSLSLDQLVLTDLLPLDLEYTGNYTFNPAGSGVPAPDSFEQIANYGNTGRMLLRWTWSAGAGVLPINTYVDIGYDTTVRNGVQLGSLSNTFDMQNDDPGLGQRCSQISSSDVLDLDGDGDVAENLCSRSASVEALPVAQLVSAKLVNGSCDAGFTASSQGALNGGALQYKISVRNTGTVTMDNFTLIDILPFVGDTGVIDTNPRNSQWEPLLVSPIVGPPGVVVYYSTSGNPCRGEVGGPTTGCDAPNWTTVPPTPVTDTKSFKLEFGSKPTVSYDSLDFTFDLTAPADLSPAEEAFNSFAWRALRSDFGTPLGAEPNKVGIALGSCPASSLGDYVWVDSDGDGTQNDGSTGLNDVQMFLYGPGADAVPGTFDDVRLATTVTMDGPTGNPGWYLFPGLDAGDYYVCADVPPTYAVTIPDQGGDDVVDSDLNPATSCTGLVALGLPEDNLDLDIGLLPPIPAALGNYVWFDRNNDGIQNESPFDGVNGVTVNLFVDDGDGVANTTADILVAVTATGSDVNGIPGFYTFDDLSPDVPYFVQFILPPPTASFASSNVGGDDSIDSDADAVMGVSHIVTLASGEFDPTLDAGLVLPTGNMSLGNQIWFENDNDGVFEPQNGETGINGARLSLYQDINGDGAPSIDEYVGATATFTSNGLDGRYLFDDMDSGEYLVVVNLYNFSGSGVLAGWQTCTGNDPAPDPDDDINGDDNGTHIGANVASYPLLLSPNGEPVNDGDNNNNSNLSLDFCFTDAAVVVPEYDYGDNPDTIFGASPDDYRTVALDQGAYHQLNPVSPYLGDCVDADNGINQDPLSSQDDNTSFGGTYGSCAIPGDDEDGVLFSVSSFYPGDTVTADVTMGPASPGNCFLNAWVDFDRDGDFTLPEQVAADVLVAPGAPVPVLIAVPSGAVPGALYSRFRCSTQSGLTPDGFAPDGEVEDYVLNIIGEDLGDLPDSYGTLIASGGAAHDVDPASPVMLGSCVDTDIDGMPGVNADGDDLLLGTSVVGLCADDEDGVTFINGNELFVCQTNGIVVTANTDALLDGWVDFNGNGVMEPVEQVFTSQPVTTGVNSLSITVPCTASAGDSYARFRISTVGGLDVGGSAPDGEVEDYLVIFNGGDLGDAAATYPVLLADNGAIHGVSSSNPLYLGSCVDTENDGQPTAGANGDDTGTGTPFPGSCPPGGDEDGVSFDSSVTACFITDITVTASADGVLDAWLDFNGDGAWDAGEQIFNGLAVVAGPNALNFAVPCDASTGNTHSRFRFSSSGVISFDGVSVDGEVEDYPVSIDAVDMGDAPDSYATLLASNGPVHVFDSSSTLYLGSCVDSEADGAPGVLDDGDDAVAGPTVAGSCTGADDEDGVVFAPSLYAGQNTDITVNASEAGVLSAWADFNNDGDFNDMNETLFNTVAVVAGANVLTAAVPATALRGDVHTRFRISSSGVAGPDGRSADGEVEDHLTQVLLAADLELTKSVAQATDPDGSGNLSPGDSVTFTITVINLGPEDATGISVQDTVPDGYSGISSISGGGSLVAGVITWSGLNINNGDNAVLTFDAVVQATGDYRNVAQVTAMDQPDLDSTPDNDDGDQSEDDEDSTTVTVNPVVDVYLNKTISTTTPNVGSVVTFTVEAGNDGPSVATGVAVQDLVPDGYSNITNISGGGVLASNTITWSGLTLGVGQVVYLTFDATVESTGDYTNIVQVTATNEFDIDSVPGNDDGDQSEDDEDAVQVNPVAIIDLSLDKTASDMTPNVTDVVTFNLLLANAGPSDATGVAVEDVLPSGYTDIVNISHSGVLDGGVITWSGISVNAGESLTLSFDGILALSGDYVNVAQVTGADQEDSDSEPDNDDGDQSQDDEDAVSVQPEPWVDLALVKTVSDGPHIVGQRVVFTLNVANTGPYDGTGVSIVDHLPSGFRDVSDISHNGSLTGETITWNGLIIPSGGSVNLTFIARIGAIPEHRNTAEVAAVDQFDPDSTPGNDDGDQSEDDEDAAELIAYSVPIPTLSQWALFLLSGLLFMTAISHRRRRS